MQGKIWCSTRPGRQDSALIGVVAWLVNNFKDRDDDNSLFSAHLFCVGKLDWREYVDPNDVEEIQNRLQLLQIITRNKYIRYLEENEMKTIPSDWGDTEKVFLVQRVSQALYHKQLTLHTANGELTHTQSDRDMMTLLHVNLIPKLGHFIDAVLTAETVDDKPALRFPIAIAVMNTVFLFFRVLGFLSQQQLTDALWQVREHYVVQNTGNLTAIQKTTVLAHVGLNCMGMAKWVDIFWLFDYLDSIVQELLQDNTKGPDRHILLDVVAEVLCCYRYQDYHSPAALQYQRFVEQRVSAKYSEDREYEFRYFADEDLPSDHEAISLYHLIAAYPSGIPGTEPPAGSTSASVSASTSISPGAAQDLASGPW